MANNVPAIVAFHTALDDAISDLVQIRDVMDATDTLWVSLDGTSKLSIRAQVDSILTTAKAKVAALVTP